MVQNMLSKAELQSIHYSILPVPGRLGTSLERINLWLGIFPCTLQLLPDGEMEAIASTASEELRIVGRIAFAQLILRVMALSGAEGCAYNNSSLFLQRFCKELYIGLHLKAAWADYILTCSSLYDHIMSILWPFTGKYLLIQYIYVLYLQFIVSK